MQKDNLCGGCVACCTVYHIEGLVHREPIISLAGNQCPLAVVGKGCQAYGSHPKDCKDYTCDWLTEASGDLTLRPDNLGVVIDTIQLRGSSLTRTAFCVVVWEYHKGAIESEVVKALVAEYVARPNPHLVLLRRKNQIGKLYDELVHNTAVTAEEISHVKRRMIVLSDTSVNPAVKELLE